MNNWLSLLKDERVKKLFLDIAREGKTHVVEFLALLKEEDEEVVEELEAGEKELRDS